MAVIAPFRAVRYNTAKISRMEDVALQDVDAIVINVDPQKNLDLIYSV